MPNVFVETEVEFSDRHSKYGGPVYDPRRDCWVFGNGAWLRQRGDRDGGERCEAPTDYIGSLEARRYFLQLKLDDELRQYNEFQNDLNNYAHHIGLYPASINLVPKPRADSADQLRRGKERMGELHHQIDAISLEIANTPEAIARRAYEEGQLKELQDVQQQLREILSS